MHSEAEPTVLVIGDLLLDHWLTGDVRRFSPEDPSVPLLDVTAEHWLPGGAANVAANIAAMGYRTQLIGAVQNDYHGDRLRSVLQTVLDVWPRVLTACNAGNTLVKTRGTIRNRQLFRFDSGVSLNVDQRQLVDEIKQAFQAAPIGAVVCSDYTRGLLMSDVRRLLVNECRRLHVPLYVDTKPAAFHDYTGATVMTPNRSEAEAGSATCTHPATISPERSDRAIAYGRHLRLLLETEAIVVTDGDGGAAVVASDAERYCPTETIFQGEVTGAGDTFLAALVASRLGHHDWLTATEQANIAAGLAVSQPMTAVVNRDQWLTRVWAKSHFIQPNQLRLFSSITTKNYQRVVFTNGVFDVLHSGHLALLQAAKAAGDLLIVGINSDESARRLKGDQRPRLPLAQRIAQLQQLRVVDAVTVFEEDTPEALIRKLKPLILVKGAEYQTQCVPGADFVASHGGEVLFVPMLPGISTTSLLVGPSS